MTVSLSRFANITLDNGDLPSQVYIAGVCHWLYMIEEKVAADDGTGNTSFITIFQEKAYLQGHKEATEWYENHPRHYSKRDDFPLVDLYSMHRNGAYVRMA